MVGGQMVQLPPVLGPGLEAPLMLWLSLVPVIALGACLARRPHATEDSSARAHRLVALDSLCVLLAVAPFLAVVATGPGLLGLRNVAMGSLLTMAMSRLTPAAPASTPWVAWVLATTLAGQGMEGPYWWAYPAQQVSSSSSITWTLMVATVSLVTGTIGLESRAGRRSRVFNETRHGPTDHY